MVIAREVLNEQLLAAAEENTELRSCIDELKNNIKAQQDAFEELLGTHKKNIQALDCLHGERLTDKMAIKDRSSEVSRLQGACDSLRGANYKLQEEKLELQLALKTLSVTIARKDHDISSWTNRQIELVAECKSREADAQNHGEHLHDVQTELKVQRRINHKLSSHMVERTNSWEHREKSLVLAANFAQAETRNNHQNWLEILNNKDTEIGHLNEVIEAGLVSGHNSRAVRTLIQINKGLRQDKIKRDEAIKGMKTDIQNLLDTKQEESKRLNAYLDETKSLRAQRAEAVDEATQLRFQLERQKTFIKKLQNVITHQAKGAETLTEGRYIPEAAVKTVVAEAIVEYYLEMEALRGDLRKEQEKYQELLIRFDSCDNELFKLRIADEFHQADVDKLDSIILSLEAEKQIFAEASQQHKQLVFAYQNPVHPYVTEIQDVLRYQIHLLQAQNQEFLSQVRIQKQEFEEARTSLETKLADMERAFGLFHRHYGELEILYWDVAVQQNDELHKELAEYKAKCGEEHYFVSKPSSHLVHERRLLQYALMNVDKDTDRKLLPPEYFDPKFLKGMHPASEMALRKLWPDLWEVHAFEAAWIPLTVPLLTNAGEIIMDEDIRIASNGRLEAFKKELEVLDEAIEQQRRSIFNFRLDSSRDDMSKVSLKSPKFGEYLISLDKSMSSEAETVSLGNSPSDCSNDTSPADKTTLEQEVDANTKDDDHSLELIYNNAAGQLMTEDEYDSLPDFAKKKVARLGAQEEEYKRMAGYSSHDHIDEEAFIAQYGQGIEGT